MVPCSLAVSISFILRREECHRLSIITCDVTFTHSCYFLFPGMCMYISSCELCSVVAILPL